jgi:tyrosyl-tRNA synthetase
MYSQPEKTPDHLVRQYFELLTDRSLECLPENPRDRQKLLALDVVSQYHGAAVAHQAQQDALALIERNSAQAQAVPEFSLAGVQFPVKLFYLLGVSGLCASSGEGRRQIEGGAVRLEGDRITDVNLSFAAPEDVVGRVLQVGKKKFVRFVP